MTMATPASKKAIYNAWADREVIVRAYESLRTESAMRPRKRSGWTARVWNRLTRTVTPP